MDANVLLLVIRTRFPLEAELERACPGTRIVVPASVVEEVRNLRDRGVRDSAAALELAARYPTVPTQARGDAAVIEASVGRHATVVTADRALGARLRRAGVDVLVPRDRHRLELRPGIPASEGRSSRGSTSGAARRRQRL